MEYNFSISSFFSDIFNNINFQSQLPTPEAFSIPPFVLNLALGILLSLIVAWYYKRYGNSFSNRSQFAPLLPMLALITLLVIAIVKSSLALSLGLVGALSIVRFRTAIKDPEELVFLFFAIAIGLGLGADQRIPTIVGTAVILGYLFIRSKISLGRGSTHSLYLNIDIETETPGETLFDTINEVLTKEAPEVDLRRIDNQEKHFQITYYLTLKDQKNALAIVNQLNALLPGCSVSLVEQNNLLGG